MILALSLLLRKRLSVGNWLVIMPNTTRSMVQLLAKGWTQVTQSQESGTSLLLSIEAQRPTWLAIEGQEVVADREYKKIGSAHAFPIVVLTIFKPNQKPIT